MSRTSRVAATALVLVMLAPALAQAQTGLGVRAGSFSVEGDHVTMDAETAFGAHLALGFIPLLKFQLGAEYSVVSQDDFGKRFLLKLHIISIIPALL